MVSITNIKKRITTIFRDKLSSHFMKIKMKINKSGRSSDMDILAIIKARKCSNIINKK